MVSIIIPAYNAAKTIRQSLESVFEQTYSSVEVIVVNDGSTDNTEEIIADLIADNKVKYIKQRNKGVSAARNLGTEMSAGEYLLFLDADDLLKKDAIATLMSNIEGFDLVFGTWEDFNDQTNAIQKTFEYDSDNSYPIAKYLKYRPTISTALVKKDKAFTWNEKRNLWEVTEYFLNIILEGRKTAFINKVVTSIRQHNSSDRVSIKFDHFNAMNTLGFFIACKEKIAKKELLNPVNETILDKLIISHAYEALKTPNNRAEIKSVFQKINFG